MMRKKLNLSPLDRWIPFVPSAVSIYVLAFLSWVVGIWVIARESPAVCYEVLAGEQIAKLLCLACFLLLPTTMERPEVTGSGFFPWLTRLIYRLDSPDNLLPSIHCLVSWMCFIGIRGNKRVPRWYRIFSCIFALLVVVSTQVTKQHYLIDAIGGILLVEVLYAWNKRSNAYLYVKGFFERVNASLRSLSRKKKGGYA